MLSYTLHKSEVNFYINNDLFKINFPKKINLHEILKQDNEF